MQKLAGMVPGQLEGALAVARAALEAREFAAAREALASHLSTPIRRVATLMAEIEEAEHGDEGRVREWMSRAMRAAGDPVWTADGVVSDRWLPVSPNGRLDGYQWRLPLAEIGVSRPVIEITTPEPAPSGESGERPMAEPAESVAAEAAPVSPKAELSGEQAPKPVAPVSAAPTPAPVVKPKPVEPVIPLVHAPDDPGPDAGLDVEPRPETTSPPSGEAWQRIKQLFR